MATWSNKACILTYNNEAPYIMAQWLGYYTSLQYREMHEKLLSIMVQNRIYKVLGANTNLPDIDEEDRKWFNDNWLPRAIKAGYYAVAVLTVKSKFNEIIIDSFYNNNGKNALTVKHFDNLNKARQWLINF
jgi:hypothetical protein